jgi:hypothetical protein
MVDKTFTVGGLKITRHCTQEEMDEFVGKLSAEQKQDVKDVIKALLNADLISLEKD